MRGERPRDRAAEKGDELAPPHAGTLARRVGLKEHAPDYSHVAGPLDRLALLLLRESARSRLCRRSVLTDAEMPI